MAGQVPAETYLIRHWRAGPVSAALEVPELHGEIVIAGAGQLRASLAMLRIDPEWKGKYNNSPPHPQSVAEKNETVTVATGTSTR